MSQPRTEAGRALLDDLERVGALDGAMGDNRPYVTTSILAIEDEAAASPVLDVERLAYALNRAFGAAVVGGPYNAIGADPMASAELLAREYAALVLSPDPGFKLSDYDPEEGVGGT